MDLADSIALSSVVVTGGGVAITAIRSFVAKKNGNGNGNGSHHCQDHSGICIKLEGIDAWLEKIEEKLDRVIEGRIGK
jgi:hypothetical protein